MARKTRTPVPRADIDVWAADASNLDYLFDAISEGSHLTAIAAKHNLAYSTLRKWLADRPDMWARYEEARRSRTEMLADEIIEISDSAPTYTDDSGGEAEVRIDGAAVAHLKLRVDSRKWLAARLLPRVYGDKVTLAGDADAPLQHKVEATMTPSEAFLALLKAGKS